jgi:hypothetical protein
MDFYRDNIYLTFLLTLNIHGDVSNVLRKSALGIRLPIRRWFQKLLIIVVINSFSCQICAQL